MKGRRAVNKIVSLNNEDGIEVNGEGLILEATVAFYNKSLVSPSPTKSHVHCDVINNRALVSKSEVALLCSEATPEEIKLDLWGVNGKKSPGFDGFTSTFSKKLGKWLARITLMLFWNSLSVAKCGGKLTLLLSLLSLKLALLLVWGTISLLPAAL